MRLKNLPIIVMVFLFTVGILVGSSHAKIDQKSVIALWLMNENANNKAIDASGNGNDGELKNGAKWGKGKFNDALELNGLGAHVEFGANENLKPDRFTIVSWFSTRKLNGYGHIFQSGKDWSDIAGIVFRVHQDGYFQAAVATAKGNTASWCNGPALTAKDWYHAALTFDDKNMLLYINGEKVANAGGGKIMYDDRVVRIGVHPDDTGAAFDGLIDEIGLFGEVLAQEDIQAIMNKGLEATAGAKAAVSSKDKLTTVWGGIRAEIYKN